MLRVTSADAARAASSQHAELAAWIAERTATVESVEDRGLLWFVQWRESTDVPSADQGRCAVVDALEGGVRILGTQGCVH